MPLTDAERQSAYAAMEGERGREALRRWNQLFTGKGRYVETTVSQKNWKYIPGAGWVDLNERPATGGAPCCKETEKDASILTEAHGLVHGDRQATYGHPAVDFSRTAALASILLSSKLKADLGPEDVAFFLVCVKLSRECNQPKRDNLVDAAGYLETLRMVRDFAASLPKLQG